MVGETEIAILAAGMLGAGIFAGVLAGLLGVGGGIVVVPVLEAVFELLGVPAEIRMHLAVGTSLAVIIPTSIVSARAHHKRGAVDVDIARRWSAYIVLGTVIGILIASRVEGTVLTGVFGVVALIVAIKMMLPLDDRTLTTEVPRGALPATIPTTIGAISTMMGIGGGSLTVVTLTLMNQPIHRAVGTSALFGLVISIPAAIGFIFSGWGNGMLPAGSIGFVNLIGFLLIAPTTVLAAPIGVRLAHALSRRTLGLLFGSFLLLVSVRMIWQTFSP
jgi:uncharacterized membrane protein YfcA